MFEILSKSEEETAAAGERLGASLKAGDVVLLYGELGAGKTAFVRGLAHGLGAEPEDVSSPTFTLIQEYPGRVSLHHVDLYRLESKEIRDLGLEDIVGGAGVVAIEWADRWDERPGDAIEVQLDHVADDIREIRISGAARGAA